MAYTSVANGVGDANRRLTLSKANRNYTTQYFRNTHTSGDIRILYLHDRFEGAGSGDVIRAVCEAYKTGSFAGGTGNAAHFTGRVADGKTVSGALNAVRATLEVAGAATTPGGTLAAIQLDSNVTHDTTLGANDAFIRVTNSGAHAITNLFNIESAKATTDAAALVTSNHDAAALNTYIKCRINGATYWLAATDHAMAGS
jgi:hypothetical protein